MLHQVHSERLYQTFYHVLLASCIIVAPLLLSGWFALCPQYGDPTCPSSVNHFAVLTAYRAANPLLLRLFLLMNVIIPYVYPFSYLGLGLLTLRRSPWLSLFGMICGWLGSIPWGLIADQSFMLNSMAPLHHDGLFVAVERGYYNPFIYVIAGGWVFGHLLGYVFLGITLLRAKVVPKWSAWSIILSAPLMGPIAYGTNNGPLQVLGYLLVFFGSIPAAMAMVQGKDEK